MRPGHQPDDTRPQMCTTLVTVWPPTQLDVAHTSLHREQYVPVPHLPRRGVQLLLPARRIATSRPQAARDGRGDTKESRGLSAIPDTMLVCQTHGPTSVPTVPLLLGTGRAWILIFCAAPLLLVLMHLAVLLMIVSRSSGSSAFNSTRNLSLRSSSTNTASPRHRATRHNWLQLTQCSTMFILRLPTMLSPSAPTTTTTTLPTLVGAYAGSYSNTSRVRGEIYFVKIQDPLRAQEGCDDCWTSFSLIPRRCVILAVSRPGPASSARIPTSTMIAVARLLSRSMSRHVHASREYLFYLFPANRE